MEQSLVQLDRRWEEQEGETVDDRDDELRFKESTTIRVRGKKTFGGAEGNEAVFVGHFSPVPRVQERNAMPKLSTMQG